MCSTKTTAQCGRTWAPRNRRSNSTVGILPRFMYCRVNDYLIPFFFSSCSFLKDYGPQSLFQSDFFFFDSLLFLSPSCSSNLDYVRVGVRAYGLLHVLPCYQQAEVPFFFCEMGILAGLKLMFSVHLICGIICLSLPIYKGTASFEHFQRHLEFGAWKSGNALS